MINGTTCIEYWGRGYYQPQVINWSVVPRLILTSTELTAAWGGNERDEEVKKVKGGVWKVWMEECGRCGWRIRVGVRERRG